MSKLDDFLGLTDVSQIRRNVSIAIGDKDYEVTIRPLTESEHSAFQSQSNKIVKNKLILDSEKYNKLAIEACVVEPNFKSEEFLKKVGCQTMAEFLARKFPAGTIVDLGNKIQRLSGFEPIDLEIENAKN